MSEKWVLVPERPTREMCGSDYIAEDYEYALSAVPPIPPDVFAEMVERGARATFLMRNGSKTCWAWDSSGLDDEHPGARERYLKDAEACLHAALGIGRAAADAVHEPEERW